MKKLVVTFTISLPIAVLEREGCTVEQAEAQFRESGNELKESIGDDGEFAMLAEVVDA